MMSQTGRAILITTCELQNVDEGSVQSRVASQGVSTVQLAQVAQVADADRRRSTEQQREVLIMKDHKALMHGLTMVKSLRRI